VTLTGDIFAVRGAVAPVANSKNSVHEATIRLLRAITARNRLRTDSIIFAFFTVTPDVNAAFPAAAARAMGWDSVPMMCALEIPVEGALTRCIRVLLLCRKPSEFPACPRRRGRRRGAAALSGVPALCPTRDRLFRRAMCRPTHVYLGEAAALRPDFVREDETLNGAPQPLAALEEVDT